MIRKLAESILCLVASIDAASKQRKDEFEWLRSHWDSATKQDLKEMEKRIMATQAELVADLKTVVAQLKKLDGDTKTLQTSVDTANAKIAELEALVGAGGTIGQELIDVVAEVKSAVQTVDDNVPEVPAPPV